MDVWYPHVPRREKKEKNLDERDGRSVFEMPKGFTTYTVNTSTAGVRVGIMRVRDSCKEKRLKARKKRRLSRKK